MNFGSHIAKGSDGRGSTTCSIYDAPRKDFRTGWNDCAFLPHIIKKDLVELVNNLLVSGKMDSRLNITNICMIPKTERSTMMTELRQISLCNVGYKIISKVLRQRLKIYLPILISETQPAFVAEMLISDNILIAHEMFHGLRTNKACQGKYSTVQAIFYKLINFTDFNLRWFKI